MVVLPLGSVPGPVLVLAVPLRRLGLLGCRAARRVLARAVRHPGLMVVRLAGGQCWTKTDRSL